MRFNLSDLGFVGELIPGSGGGGGGGGGSPFTAVSAALTDVQQAVNLAVNDGDVVIVPPQTATWNGPLLTNKNITLMGGGLDLSTGNCATTIIAGTGGVPLIKATTNSSAATFRITGLELNFPAGVKTDKPLIQMTGNAQVKNNGGVYSGGFRLDHLKFSGSVTSHLINFYNGYCTGVIDHCFIDHDVRLFGGETLIVSQSTNLSGTGSGGNYAWSIPFDFGGSDFNAVYIEDCVIKHRPFFADSGTGVGGSGYGAGQMVCRYNTSYGQLASGHGTESGSTPVSGDRGVRASECYNNLHYFLVGLKDPTGASLGRNPAQNVRSGSTVVFNNRYVGWSSGNVVALYAYRIHQNAGAFGGASGSNLWDSNQKGNFSAGGFSYTAVPAGAGIGDVYASGSNGSNTGTTINLVDLPFGNGDTNKWTGFVIQNSTMDINAVGNPPPFTWIVSSSARVGGGTTLTTVGPISFGGSGTNVPPMPLTSGQAWVIRKVAICIDVPGSGNSDMIITGSPPSSPHWTGQPAEGCWNFPGTNKMKSLLADTTWQPAQSFQNRPTYGLAIRGAADTIKPGYPELLSPPTTRKRIGADWNDPTGVLPHSYQGTDTANAATRIWGADYPHPLTLL